MMCMLYNHGVHSVMKGGILLTHLGIVPQKIVALPGKNQVKNGYHESPNSMVLLVVYPSKSFDENLF